MKKGINREIITDLLVIDLMTAIPPWLWSGKDCSGKTILCHMPSPFGKSERRGEHAMKESKEFLYSWRSTVLRQPEENYNLVRVDNKAKKLTENLPSSYHIHQSG